MSTLSSLVLSLAVVASCRLLSGSYAFGVTRMSMMSAKNSLVVISPPGGVGEVTAVKAAKMGSSVKWFVVASSDKNTKVVLSPDDLERISKAGGSVELAGVDAPSLLGEDAPSAITAVNKWCANADSLVCTMDGTNQASKGKIDEEDPKKIWENAIKVAAQEAGKSIDGLKIAVISAEEDDSDGDEVSGGVSALLQSVMGRNSVSVPSSLASAMAAAGGNLVKLRHGELFGIPESSPNFSALVGGPRKDAMLCEEYTMRSIRMDPSLSVSGNIGMGTRTSRHAVGEVAALIALQELPISTSNLDMCVSSQVGTDPVTVETWEAELKRVENMLKSGQGAQLFTAEFSKVPNVERLADWLATKWAPAVLRTYDIAAIRVGERPVYASRTGEGQVEIVWQQLDNFESVIVGKMLIQVSNDGLVATRAAGDATKGYGSISKKPLNGESVLVRRLVDAASQAIEKGLAVKPVAAKKPKLEKKKVEQAVPVTSVQASGTVPEAEAVPSLETGPRTAGARRSSERDRGTRKRKSSKPEDEKSGDEWQ